MTETRGKSLLEVVLVFVLTVLLSWALGYAFAGFFAAELSLLGWTYVGGSIFILISILVILLTRRGLESYGITRKEWGDNLDVGLKCYLVALIPWASYLALVTLLGVSYLDPAGSLILAIGYALATVLVLVILRRGETREKAASTRSPSTTVNIFVIAFLLMFPILAGIYLHKLTLKVTSTVIWQFVFSGFGEELRYRGYYQSRINQEFGRKYNFLGVKFGPGLIVASLLFAIAHVLNPFNPFTGSFTLTPFWGVFTFISGLFFGLIREKTGSLVSAGIAHGLPDAVGEAMALVL